jgi:hypothetical protein
MGFTKHERGQQILVKRGYYGFVSPEWTTKLMRTVSWLLENSYPSKVMPAYTE